MLTAEKAADAGVESRGGGRAAKSARVNETALLELFRRVESEYREMPGLSLTLPQAARLWGLDRRTCEFVLTTLTERRVLRRTTKGTYTAHDQSRY
jgi:hypothetical protein